MHNDGVLHELSGLITSQGVSQRIAPVLTRVESVLAASPEQPQAWESVPLSLFGLDLPAGIKSCWVFVLRSGISLGAERHPNSDQRTVALRGSALFEIFISGVWSPRPIDAAHTNPIEGRWVSISASTWHRIKVGPQNLLSCSFHTVPEAELIEETPVGDDLSVTRTRRYHT